jgi:hypothetical protein
MNASTHVNSTGFSAGTRPVFSLAIRFAPKELSPFQAIRLIAYWAAIIVIVVAMARSGFSHLSQVWSQRPGHHSVK